MQLKEGVSIAGIRPEIVLALIIAESIFSQHSEPLVVTSAIDGEHMRGSLHYVGAAVDLRYPVQWRTEIIDALVERLGDNYDVIMEHNHIHIEFQPKIGAH